MKSTLWPTPSKILLLKQIDDLLQNMQNAVIAVCFSESGCCTVPVVAQKFEDCIVALFSATTKEINAHNHSGLY